MPSVAMLRVIVLGVVMLNVVAPLWASLIFMTMIEVYMSGAPCSALFWGGAVSLPRNAFSSITITSTVEVKSHLDKALHRLLLY